jgi:hypothetical protein
VLFVGQTPFGVGSIGIVVRGLPARAKRAFVPLCGGPATRSPALRNAGGLCRRCGYRSTKNN